MKLTALSQVLTKPQLRHLDIGIFHVSKKYFSGGIIFANKDVNIIMSKSVQMKAKI
jgi:hypothetical protein